nr:hypothetical protein LTR18_010571 [Exophiala xenobiotica]
MSTTATSLVPSSVRSATDSALQSTRNVGSALQSAQNVVSSEVASTTGYLKTKAQELRLTPSKPTAGSSLHTASPGNFRHPQITEILARNSAASLSDRRVKGAVTNAAALLLSFMFSNAFCSTMTPLLRAAGIADARDISSTILTILRLLLSANMIFLLRPAIPYIAKQDQIADIPLTPSQRSLLGLDPSVEASPSPAGSYITPPRYRRSSGSFSGGSRNGYGLTSTGRRSISANYSSSPMSASRGTLGLSPSPAASPLFHKAVNQSSHIPDLDFGTTGRSSFGASTGSGVGRSQSLRDRSRRESIEPTSPTPGTKSPQIVPGLNYKWLYDKGRKLPKSESYGF